MTSASQLALHGLRPSVSKPLFPDDNICCYFLFSLTSVIDDNGTTLSLGAAVRQRQVALARGKYLLPATRRLETGVRFGGALFRKTPNWQHAPGRRWCQWPKTRNRQWWWCMPTEDNGSQSEINSEQCRSAGGCNGATKEHCNWGLCVR